MENYEISDGVSLARSAIYNHYLNFCQKNSITPANAASFGKVSNLSTDVIILLTLTMENLFKYYPWFYKFFPTYFIKLLYEIKVKYL